MRGPWSWVWARVWSRLWRAATVRWGENSVTATLHGRRALINFANPYPLSTRLYPNYNAPQVEVVLATAAVRGRAVNVVDVGAAVGDTALLLLDRCREKMAWIDLVEGEPAFASLLRWNVRDAPAEVHEVTLSASPGRVPALVRSQHEGTASAEGSSYVPATTLDLLLERKEVDVLKVDTDGYDGPIISGGREILSRCRPTVLFEWHPKLCQNVGVEDSLAFACLKDAGYDRFIFFTKFGQFSHFGVECLQDLRMLCLGSTTLHDWHYDVVALHHTSTLSAVDLADLQHWGRSGY